MQDELSFLIQLQQHDKIVDELNEKVTSFAPLIQSKQTQIETLKNNLKTAKDSFASNQSKKKQLELDVDAKEKQISKFHTELGAIKSNDAYRAMLTEIENAKKDITKIEDEILVVMETIDKAEKDYKEKEKIFKSDEGKIKAEIQALESQKATVTQEAKTKKEERDAYAATVPTHLRSQYEMIRGKKGGVAIVPLINGSCGGCRLKLTPAKANEVMKAKTMVLCDSCSRIIYNPPSSAGTTATPGKPAEAPASAS